MIIGVDAGALSISDTRLQVGVWRVSFEILKALSTLDTTNSYRLYSFTPIPKYILSQFGKNFTNIVLSPSLGYLKVRLPIELLLHPVDIFLGLSQALPTMRTGKQIGFVYDLGFISSPSLYGMSAGKLSENTASIAKQADSIITISESVKQDIQKRYGYPINQIQVIAPGVSDIFFTNKEKKVLDYPYILFVGSLRKGKNIPKLLQSFHSFLQTTSSALHLVLIGGDYWHDTQIDKTIKELRLEDRVHRIGYVDDVELARFYRGATAFVTLSKVEGYCIPIVEAFACGCPVIASDIGPIRELVGDDGMLVNPDVEKDFVRALRTLAEDTALQERYRKLGMKKSLRYTWRACAQKVFDTYTV